MFLHRGWTVSGLISVIWKIGFGCWRRGPEVESRHTDMRVCGVRRKGIKVIFFYIFFFLHFFTLL